MAMTMRTRTIRPPTAPRGFWRQKRQTAPSPGTPAGAARAGSVRGAGSAFGFEGEVSVSTWLAMASVPDARIEIGVARVHGEVHEHHDGDDEEIDPLDHRIVALVDGIEEEAPHARQAEDRLENHHSAEDLRDLRAEHGDDRDEGVLEAVLEDDPALAHPLGPGRAHVVLAEDLQELGPGQAHHGGRGGDAEDEGRNDELRDVRPRIGAELRVLDGRAPVPPER